MPGHDPGPSPWKLRSRFIDEIEAGMVFVNGMVASGPRPPSAA